MEDLLGTLIKVAGAASQAQSGGKQPAAGGQADLIGELLGGLLGGGQAAGGRAAGGQSGGGQAAGMPAGGLADIMEMVLGGGQAAGGGQQAGGIGGILGSMGGGQNPLGIGNYLAEILAEKTGLSPAIANAIVAFFIAKFLSPQGGPASGAAGIKASPAGGINLDNLLDIMDDDDQIDSKIANSGMHTELAQRAGIDEKTAAHGLQELVKILGGQRRTPRPVASKATNLKGLLDSWEVD